MTRLDSSDLDPLWLRSAMLGSTWAAVEIVLGSFLHNMRFPLTGTILASLGIVILVAGARIWPVHGLVWRAGLICALMKSISPSAVIIGPMIGIASEALLVEVALRVLGTNALGLLAGGAAAALLPVIQKIVSLIVTYGPDITLLYVRLVEFAADSLALPALGPVDVLVAFAGASVLIGLAAAVTGMVVGRLVLEVPTSQAVHNGSASPFAPAAADPAQQFSLVLLIMHVIAMLLGFLAIRTLPFWASLAYVVLYVVVVLRLYPGVMRKLSRPRLWLEFAVISILAGLLLGEVHNAEEGWQWSGLVIGAEMSLRASMVVVGFSSIGVELRNPVVLTWFFRRGLGELAMALEVAFESLPHMISAFGDQKSFFRSPVQALTRTIAAGVAWLELREDPQAHRATIFVVTGEKGAGKTTFLSRLVQELQAEGVSVGGILAPEFWERNERRGFEVCDIRTNATTRLCTKDTRPTGITAGPYVFNEEGIAFGRKAVEDALADAVQVLCIDEIGPLEISGGGWSPSLTRALHAYRGILVLVIRSRLLEQSREAFGFAVRATWMPSDANLREAVTTIRDALSSHVAES